MAMGNSGDDILRPKRGVTTEKDLRITRLKSRLIDPRHIPFSELNAKIALYPRKCVVLTDRDQNLIRFEKDFVASRHEAAFAVSVVHYLHLIERHAQ